MLAQPVERPFVEAAVVREPGVGLGERFTTQVSGPLLGSAAARHEACPLEHLEVLADRLQGDGREERSELVDGRVALGQPGQHDPAGRVGKRSERDAQRLVAGRDDGGQIEARVSSATPDGAVVLLATVNLLAAGPVKSLRPSPSTIGQISKRYSSMSPAARSVSVSWPLP